MRRRGQQHGGVLRRMIPISGQLMQGHRNKLWHPLSFPEGVLHKGRPLNLLQELQS